MVLDSDPPVTPTVLRCPRCVDGRMPDARFAYVPGGRSEYTPGSPCVLCRGSGWLSCVPCLAPPVPMPPTPFPVPPEPPRPLPPTRSE